jgi:putative ATP-binding cassette transporter
MSWSDRHTWKRFVRITRLYFVSEARGAAFRLLSMLILVLLSLTALNVVNSYVGRDFMSAIAERQTHAVYWLALIYLGVFAASTVAGALELLVEQMLALRWRNWLTENLLGRYLMSHTFFRLNARADVDNPDQRMSEDIRTFTSTTLSLFVMAANSAITVVAFAGVLWSISGWLFLAALVYPLVGTSLIVLVGRRLVGLNNQQLRKEADFRFALTHVRAHAEPIALAQAEGKEGIRLRSRLTALVTNYRAIIQVLFNLKFFTGGYNFLTQLIPVLIVAPMYLSGQVEFGVITQAAMAFSQVFGAFSLIVEEFQVLSQLAAVIDRLGSLREALVKAAEPARPTIHIVEQKGRVAFHRLTLLTRGGDRELLHELTLEMPRGRRVLLAGPNSAAKHALFRAAAGLWDKGCGEIVRPPGNEALFLAEVPYVVPGRLGDQFFPRLGEEHPSDERMHNALRAVHLEALVRRVGGLGAEQDWPAVLSLAEQQLIAFARLLMFEPEFALLDRATSALSEPVRQALYERLERTPITYMSIGDDWFLPECHDLRLELECEGTWKLGPIHAAPDGPQDETEHRPRVRVP